MGKALHYNVTVATKQANNSAPLQSYGTVIRSITGLHIMQNIIYQFNISQMAWKTGQTVSPQQNTFTPKTLIKGGKNTYQGWCPFSPPCILIIQHST